MTGSRSLRQPVVPTRYGLTKLVWKLFDVCFGFWLTDWEPTTCTCPVPQRDSVGMCLTCKRGCD
jgi:hypothetical protein